MVGWVTIKQLNIIDENELFALDYNNFEINSTFIGNARVVTVDNFFKNPDKIREFSLSLPFSKKKQGYFPGVRSQIKIDTTEIKKGFTNILQNVFKETNYKLKISELNVNMINSNFNGEFKDRDKKEYFCPHHDSLPWQNPMRFRKLFASTVWLNTPEECNGGTSFWKNKDIDSQCFLSKKYLNRMFDILKSLPSFEKECLNWVDKYTDAKKFEDSKNIEVKNKWWVESNDKWELLDITEMKYNRMVMYQGIYFHTQHVQKDWFNKFPRMSLQFFM